MPKLQLKKLCSSTSVLPHLQQALSLLLPHKEYPSHSFLQSLCQIAFVWALSVRKKQETTLLPVEYSVYAKSNFIFFIFLLTFLYYIFFNLLTNFSFSFILSPLILVILFKLIFKLFFLSEVNKKPFTPNFLIYCWFPLNLCPHG